MKTVYHIGSGATQFPYDVDADNAVQRHPAEWSATPWPVEKTNAYRQNADMPELSLSPQAQAEVDQDAKNREEAQKVVDEADKREAEAREWTEKVAAARATLAAAPVQPSQLAADTEVVADKNTEIPPGWRDMANARRRGLALRLGAPRDIKMDAVNGYIEAEEKRRAAPPPAAPVVEPAVPATEPATPK